MYETNLVLQDVSGHDFERRLLPVRIGRTIRGRNRVWQIRTHGQWSPLSVYSHGIMISRHRPGGMVNDLCRASAFQYEMSNIASLSLLLMTAEPHP